MIHVNKSQVNQVEYLIQQSSQGHHILFDMQTLRSVFGAGRKDPHSTGKSFKDRQLAPSPELTEAEAYEIEPILERLIQEPTLERKRAFVDGLDRETLEKVVRTYFTIVENQIFETLEVHH